MIRIQMQDRDANKAFTLIELLVVIAIIAILAAILFPVFATAREKARQTTCTSNEKQLGIAFLSYVNDFDEVMPSGLLATSGNPSANYPVKGANNVSTGVIAGCGWAGQIYPYVKARGVFTCPSDPNAVLNGTTQSVDYAYDAYTAAQNLSKASSPATIMLLSEVTGWQVNVTDSLETGGNRSVIDNGQAIGYMSPGTTSFNQVWSNTVPATGQGLYATGPYSDYNSSYANEGTTARHSGGANYLLSDGHVKWFPSTKVSALCWSGGTVCSLPVIYRWY